MKSKKPDVAQISDFEKKLILKSIKEREEKFKSITFSSEAVVSKPLDPENLVPSIVTPQILKAIGSKLSNAFFLGTTWSSSVDIEFDSFIIPYMDVVTKMELLVNELELDDGTKKQVNLSAEDKHSGKSFQIEVSKDILSSKLSADPKVKSISGVAKLTYHENFPKVSMKAAVGNEMKLSNGGMIKIIKFEKDFVQVKVTSEKGFYDIYAEDDKGVLIESHKFSDMPIAIGGKLLTELNEEQSLKYMINEHLGEKVNEGELINIKFNGIPANIHFLELGKTKEFVQKFIAFGKPEMKDISKIIGTRYIKQKKPEPYSFPEKELTEELTLTLRRDRTGLAYLDDGPYSNELILDLENLRKIQDEDRLMELTDVKLFDSKGKEVPIYVKQKDSFGSKEILIQVPRGADGNIDKKALTKEKKPIFPNGTKLIGKLKLELPVTYEIFSWPEKPLPGIKVDIKGNDIVFGMSNKNDFSPSDFFVSDGGKYALYAFGKNHTSWTNGNVDKIERYWGKPKNVMLNTPIQKIVYEGQFEFKVPPPLPVPAKDSNPFLDDGPKLVIEKNIISKIKNFSKKLVSIYPTEKDQDKTNIPNTTSNNPDIDVSELKMFDQMEALYVKKGLTKEIAKQTVEQIKTSLKGLTKAQRATSLQSMLSALK